MNDGDDPGRSRPSTAAYPGTHILPPISLPLHEAVGLVLLYQAASELVLDLKVDDVLYSFSAAYGYLHLREAIAKLYGDEDTLAQVAVDRAEIDQYQQHLLS